MKKQTDRLKSLISSVQIQGIRLTEISANTRIRSSEDVGAVNFRAKTSTSVSEQHKDGTFFVVTFIDAQLAPKEEEKNPVVTIKAGFEIRYKLPGDFAASRSEITSFAKTNGVYNAWPYWRELIQNTFARMNLPPVVLPLLRMGSGIPQAKQEKAQARARD